MSKFHFLRDSEVATNANFDLLQLKEAGHGDIAILLRLYYSLEFAIGQVFADGDETYYPNASFSVFRFMAKLRLIQRMCGAGLRFLDVGCGAGNKVWIAQALGFEAYGLEINPKYAEIAGECVGTNRILCHDGISFPDYDDYDVIYFYNPMPSSELESAILANARKGAIIYHAIGLQKQPNRAFVRLTPRVMQLTDEAPKRQRTLKSGVGGLSDVNLPNCRPPKGDLRGLQEQPSLQHLRLEDFAQFLEEEAVQRLRPDQHKPRVC
jgi:SAM-dependent methyltransferase